jgi:translation elongation factor EF-Tu-like GTPase
MAGAAGQFGVHEVAFGADVTHVTGRCYTGSLRIGDVIRGTQASSGEHAAVELTIVAIECYGHLMDEIQEGLTARLTLRGTGAEHLAAETVLST